ncbi:TetR/AcrR family transcriptional regulator [Micromonospora sp. NPDC005189]|uniref:TetR/AcrR family transcriptional regulator n=1 Tax=Micromonospora sp. NPDC005189 TaxID=3157019 RepID=UPI0033BEBFFB
MLIPYVCTTPSSNPSLGGLARRAQLVACAVDVLVERGFAGTSVAEVARRAGVSKGVVNCNFPTKEDLSGEEVTSLYRDAGTKITEATGDGDSVIGELATYIRSNLAFVAHHPRHVRAVMEVAANMRPADATPGGEDPLSAHLRELFERGQATGEVADVDAGVLALTIRASIDTAAARATCDPTADPRGHAEHLVTIVRRAMQAKELR